MRTGLLRHRVTIQKPISTAKGDDGAPIITWEKVLDTWASVEPLSGREYFDAQQVNADVTHKASMRYRSGIDSTMRILLGSRLLLILAVLNTEERSRELVLMCREEV